MKSPLALWKFQIPPFKPVLQSLWVRLNIEEPHADSLQSFHPLGQKHHATHGSIKATITEEKRFTALLSNIGLPDMCLESFVWWLTTMPMFWSKPGGKKKKEALHFTGPPQLKRDSVTEGTQQAHNGFIPQQLHFLSILKPLLALPLYYQYFSTVLHLLLLCTHHYPMSCPMVLLGKDILSSFLCRS